MEQKSDITKENEAVDGSQFYGLVRCTILETSEKYLLHVSGHPSARGKNLPSIFNAPAFTD